MEKIKVADLLKKLKFKKPEDMLCFDSLAYCCGLEKDCFKRTLYMQINNISKEKFLKIKSKCDKMFKETTSCKTEVILGK